MNKLTKRLVGTDKLTSYEWQGLGKGYNIADGHAHQGQSPEHLKIHWFMSVLLFR